MKQLILILGLPLILLTSVSAQEVLIDLKAVLEGPYSPKSNRMSTKLHDLGYLPGMTPKSFFGKAVPFFDPYVQDDRQKSTKVNVTYPEETVDWIEIVITEAQSDRVVARRTTLLLSDGTVSQERFDRSLFSLTKAYKIAIQHRNHLSAQSPPLKLSNNKMTYDFTKAQDPSLKSIGDISALYAGNIYRHPSKKAVNAINSDDITQWQSVNGKNSSYYVEDVDLNGDISVHDQSIILENLDIASSVRINE